MEVPARLSREGSVAWFHFVLFTSGPKWFSGAGGQAPVPRWTLPPPSSLAQALGLAWRPRPGMVASLFQGSVSPSDAHESHGPMALPLGEKELSLKASVEVPSDPCC